MAHRQQDQPIVIPMEEDDPIHTEEYPFCSADPDCSCHEDPWHIAAVADAVARGELTPDEATRFVSGKLV